MHDRAGRRDLIEELEEGTRIPQRAEGCRRADRDCDEDRVERVPVRAGGDDDRLLGVKDEDFGISPLGDNHVQPPHQHGGPTPPVGHFVPYPAGQLRNSPAWTVELALGSAAACR